MPDQREFAHCAAPGLPRPAASMPLPWRAHARFPRMNELRLRFCDGDQPDLLLGSGLHALGRLPNGLGPVESEQPWLVQLCNDRRGIWMTVADDLRGVHVNGRPVQHVAMLRAGDSIHVDGGELLLTSANAPGPVLPIANTRRDVPANGLRLVLRGIGGQHHGRSICLDQPRRIGRACDADIRIDGQNIGEHHAVVAAINGQAVLRDAQADVMVNGHRTRSAELLAGDQIAFDVQHRFVVEGPPPAAVSGNAKRAYPGFGDESAPPPRNRHRTWLQRVPWLLLAAVLLAAALTGLLLFGAR
jgi:hypothetical protein